MAESKVDPYPFHADFERVVVSMAAARPRFYGTAAHALVVEALPTEAARLALQAVKAIAHDLGHGPDDPTAVLQRIRRWMNEGKVTKADMLDVEDFLMVPSALPAEDVVLGELVPILKRRLQHEAILAAHEGFSHRDDLSRAEQMFSAARSIGTGDVSLGVEMGESGFDLMAKQRNQDRMPTGIDELDSELEGGLPRGQLIMFIAASGGGKSMSLSHTSARAMLNPESLGGYITLELPPAHVVARVMANLTGVPTNGILSGGPEEQRARDILSQLPLGKLRVKDFTPQVTTVDEITSWVRLIEEREGRRMDYLVVDYADKLAPPPKKGRDENGYKAMEYVYEGLRTFVLDRKMWGFTASQSQGRKDERKAKRIDMEHVADSMNKVRVVDIVVTLNYDDEAQEMTFFIAKNRTGRSRREVGPLPVDFGCGAVAPVVRGTTPF